MNRDLIGVTEGADPTINTKWLEWVGEGRPAILITKSPRLMMTDFLHGGENIIVHCTITGLGGTVLEPNIDDPMTSIHYYHRLCSLLGKDRVVLRIDPVIPRWSRYVITPDMIVKEAEGRVRISFLDQYNYVKDRLFDRDIFLPWSGFHAPYIDRVRIWRCLKEPEVCAEPGIISTSCVEEIDCKVLGIAPRLYRKGQRDLCECLGNKIEICQPPPRCTYRCLYCYWKDNVNEIE